MGLKYYLRGLGVGIFVTAVILSATKPTAKTSMTDAEVIARAKVLGMVEGQTLAEADASSDLKDNTKQDVQEAKDSKDSKDGKKAEAPEEKTPKDSKDRNYATQDAKDAKEAVDGKEAKQDKPDEKPATNASKASSVIISVYPGEGSYTVSKKLATQGLVESADIFDQYLCQNGYDKKLCTGNYEIKVGAGAEEIAKALTRQNG